MDYLNFFFIFFNDVCFFGYFCFNGFYFEFCLFGIYYNEGGIFNKLQCNLCFVGRYCNGFGILSGVVVLCDVGYVCIGGLS